MHSLARFQFHILITLGDEVAATDEGYTIHHVIIVRIRKYVQLQIYDMCKQKYIIHILQIALHINNV